MKNTLYTVNGIYITVDELKEHFSDYLTSDFDWNNPDFRAIADEIMEECNVGITASELRSYFTEGGYETTIAYGYDDPCEETVVVTLSEAFIKGNKVVVTFGYEDLGGFVDVLYRGADGNIHVDGSDLDTFDFDRI